MFPQLGELIFFSADLNGGCFIAWDFQKLDIIAWTDRRFQGKKSILFYMDTCTDYKATVSHFMVVITRPIIYYLVITTIKCETVAL